MKLQAIGAGVRKLAEQDEPSLTSLAKACKCRTRLRMISRKRGSGQASKLAIAALVISAATV